MRVSIAALVSLIEKKRYREALLAAVSPPVFNSYPAKRAAKLLPALLYNRWSASREFQMRRAWEDKFINLAHSFSPGSTKALIGHYFKHYHKTAGNYFAYKFAQPKHFVALSLLSAARPDAAPSVDLGCGAGTLVRHLSFRANGQPVVGLDLNFFLLWVAKTRVAPDSSFICCDAGAGLPFSSEAMGTIVCSNMIQFIYPKRLLAHEIERVARADALIVLSSVRHSLYKALTANIAIPPESYGQLFTRPHTVVDEEEILQRYLRGYGPNLKQLDRTKGSLADSPLIDVVVSGDRTRFQEWGSFAQWPHAVGRLDINPLYKSAWNGDRLELRLDWPSNHFREDNTPMEDYLPVHAELTEMQMEDIRNNTISDAVKPLVDRGVVVDVPVHY
ncbi:MAG: class I SAM-dependent methyltransferase [Pseudomonadota bacterium]